MILPVLSPQAVIQSNSNNSQNLNETSCQHCYFLLLHEIWKLKFEIPMRHWNSKKKEGRNDHENKTRFYTLADLPHPAGCCFWLSLFHCKTYKFGATNGRYTPPKIAAELPWARACDVVHRIWRPVATRQCCRIAFLIRSVREWQRSH